MTFRQLVEGPSGILSVIQLVVVPLIITLCFLVFIYGVVKYFFIQGDQDKSRSEGRQYMLWGILALAIMFSTWGIISFLLSTLGILPR